MKNALTFILVCLIASGLAACDSKGGSGVTFNRYGTDVGAADSVNSYRWEQQREWNPPGWRANR